jgi:hypothetical protein
MQMINLDISLRFWIWKWSLLRVLNKVTQPAEWSFDSSQNMERRTVFGENHWPSCEKSHTQCATNMRGPSFILITQFTTKIELITVVNERCRMSFLHTRSKSCQGDLKTSWPWWNYKKHDTLTQNTSLKGTQISCHLPQRSPAHHQQCSVPQAEFTVIFKSQPASLHSLAVCDWAHMPTVFVMIKFAFRNYVRNIIKWFSHV